MGFNFEKPTPAKQEVVEPILEFSNETNIHIVMPRSEYEDLLNMRNFIYDNNFIIQYEMYLDVVKQVNDLKNTLKDGE